MRSHSSVLKLAEENENLEQHSVRVPLRNSDAKPTRTDEIRLLDDCKALQLCGRYVDDAPKFFNWFQFASNRFVIALPVDK